jgi:hypothetical protein
MLSDRPDVRAPSLNQESSLDILAESARNEPGVDALVSKELLKETLRFEF